MRAMSTLRLPAPLLCLGAALGGCAVPQAGYSVMMEAQKQECRKMPDLDQRARCLKEADRPYDRYKAEAEAARRP